MSKNKKLLKNWKLLLLLPLALTFFVSLFHITSFFNTFIPSSAFKNLDENQTFHFKSYACYKCTLKYVLEPEARFELWDNTDTLLTALPAASEHSSVPRAASDIRIAEIRRPHSTWFVIESRSYESGAGYHYKVYRHINNGAKLLTEQPVFACNTPTVIQEKLVFKNWGTHCQLSERLFSEPKEVAIIPLDLGYACTESTPSFDSWNTYTHKTHGYSFKYPPSWEIDEDDEDITVLHSKCLTPEERIFVFEVVKNIENQTPEQYLTSLIRENYGGTSEDLGYAVNSVEQSNYLFKDSFSVVNIHNMNNPKELEPLEIVVIPTDSFLFKISMLDREDVSNSEDHVDGGRFDQMIKSLKFSSTE